MSYQRHSYLKYGTPHPPPSGGDEPPAISPHQTDDGAVRVLHVGDESGFSELVNIFVDREDDRFTIVQATSASNCSNIGNTGLLRRLQSSGL